MNIGKEDLEVYENDLNQPGIELDQALIDLELMREAEILREYYHFIQGNCLQSNVPFTLILVSIHSFDHLVQQHGIEVMKEALMEIHKYLAQEKGSADIIFRLPTQHIWVLLITKSSIRETVEFLEKLVRNAPSILDEANSKICLMLSGCIVEANLEKLDIERILEFGKRQLEEALKSGPFAVKIVKCRD